MGSVSSWKICAIGGGVECHTKPININKDRTAVCEELIAHLNDFSNTF